MSTYKIQISKNSQASAEDQHIDFVDSDTGTQDVAVTLWVDDQEVHARTLTDDGAVLMHTGTLAEGYHTIKVMPQAGQPTDIHIDRVLIDDHTVVGSQYLMDTRIFGKDHDMLRHKICKPFRSPKSSDHVWWGEVYSADHTVNSHTTHYRPHVVTDLGEWWQWDFSVTSNGHIHWLCDDSDSILYDSTENHIYYAAKSLLYNDSSVFPMSDTAVVDEWRNSTADDSTPSAWNGVGVYNSTFVQSTWVDTGYEDYAFTSLYSHQEWIDAVWFYKMYWPRNNIDPIVIT